MDASRDYLIGLDVGGTKIAVVLATAAGEILDKERRPTRAERGVDAIVAELVEMVERIREKAGLGSEHIRGLGVSFGGPYDTRSGTVRAVPNLPGWEGFPLHRALQEAFPRWEVAIDNDANASALAEWRFGAGRGHRHVLYMTMGTGIGGGIVADGRILRGATDMAGEIGHITLVPDGPTCGCGKRGCLEAFCSGPSIARRAKEKIDSGMDPGDLLTHAGVTVDALRTEDLLEAARRGNAFALNHFRETAYYMGWGIACAVNLLNPEVVVLGTVATAAGDLFFEPLREYVRYFAMRGPGEAVRVVPAQLGDLVGDYAAIALVMG